MMGLMNDQIYSFECGDRTELLDTMKMFRFGFKTLGDLEVEEVLANGGLPGGIAEEPPAPLGSFAVEYRLAGGTTMTISPSGAKPELKVQIRIAADNPEEAEGIEKRICEDIDNIVHLNSRMGFCCE